MRRACHKPRDQGTRGRQGEEGVGGMPRVLLREVYVRGVKGGRGQGDKGPGTQGHGKGHKAVRPRRCSVLRSVMQRGPARTREEGTNRAKEVGHLGKRPQAGTVRRACH